MSPESELQSNGDVIVLGRYALRLSLLGPKLGFGSGLHTDLKRTAPGIYVCYCIPFHRLLSGLYACVIIFAVRTIPTRCMWFFGYLLAAVPSKLNSPSGQNTW